MTGSSTASACLAGDGSVEELERERDEMLMGLLALRARSVSAVAAK